jgi:chromosome segregation ATPase
MVEEQATKISSLQEKVTTAEAVVGNLTTENQNYSIKVGELEENISTLTTERDDAQTNFANVSAQLDEVNNALNTEREAAAALRTEVETLTSNYTALETERNELATFKKNVIDNEKKLVIEAYNETLDAEVLETYTQNMDQYTAEELDMRLTYECKKINPTIFSKNPVNPQPSYLPKEEPTGRGINDILAHYEKK